MSLADEAIRIGPAPALESYLKGETILEAARRSGAQARENERRGLADKALTSRVRKLKLDTNKSAFAASATPTATITCQCSSTYEGLPFWLTA